MAKYVVLRFEDNDQADTFVEDMLREPDEPILTPVQENDVRATPVGVYRAPTMFCARADGRHKGRVQGFTHGKKFGWWVCGQCGKPTLLWGSSHQAVIGSGVNLLPDAKEDKLEVERNQQHWRQVGALTDPNTVIKLDQLNDRLMEEHNDGQVDSGGQEPGADRTGVVGDGGADAPGPVDDSGDGAPRWSFPV